MAAAIGGLYRRTLPSPPAVDFTSAEGKQLFSEANENRTMEGFYQLISYYQTQSEPAYCGLASLSVVLNALAIDPGRKWKGPWRWFDESMLDCCETMEKVKSEGISFGKLVCMAICAGAKVESFRTNHSTLEGFREQLIKCSTSDHCHLIASYHRGIFKQTGSGHFSPIGGYHVGKDMALILDVARFKYPPHWVPVPLLWEAMDQVDKKTGQHRGFMLISRPHRESGTLYTLSCQEDNWVVMARYLMDHVPLLFKSDDVKEIEKVLSVVFTSLPSNFGDFTKWIIEVRRQEDSGRRLSQEEKAQLDVKEEVLKQIQQTGLYNHVAAFLSSANLRCRKMTSLSDQGLDLLVHSSQIKKPNCDCGPNNCPTMYPGGDDVLTVLLLALPPETWSGIQDETLSREIYSLVSTTSLPTLLQEEVLQLRSQLELLKKCQENKLDEDPSWSAPLDTSRLK